MKVEDAPVVAPKVIVEDKVDPAKVAKPKAEKKVIAEKVPVFTRMEAIGQTLKKFEALYTPEEMIAAADTLYTERTGKPSNLKESKCLYGFAVNFLAGYNK